MSALEALQRFDSIITSYFSEYQTVAIKKSKYNEVITDSNSINRYYRAKYYYLTIDERNGVEKKTTMNTLIQADDYDSAKTKYEELVKTWMVDVELACISDTKIVDYYPTE